MVDAVLDDLGFDESEGSGSTGKRFKARETFTSLIEQTTRHQDTVWEETRLPRLVRQLENNVMAKVDERLTKNKFLTGSGSPCWDAEKSPPAQIWHQLDQHGTNTLRKCCF